MHYIKAYKEKSEHRIKLLGDAGGKCGHIGTNTILWPQKTNNNNKKLIAPWSTARKDGR